MLLFVDKKIDEINADELRSYVENITKNAILMQDDKYAYRERLKEYHCRGLVHGHGDNLLPLYSMRFPDYEMLWTVSPI
jgi:hypothetical protein